MKVSISWLKELVDLKVTTAELIRLLPLRTIGLKEATPDYIELDMKGYNRADLLSLRGVAYEIAAITSSPVKFNEKENYFWENMALPAANAIVENVKLAPVYCIAQIENLKVEYSNEIWVKKLFASGIRSINNVADITNLIMLEYGQPMHAFDKEKVKTGIKVRTARKNEQIITLDGKIRSLTDEDLLITDNEKPIGIAGIMGGKESEVSSNTSSILLEAAIFDPKTLRKTATRLDLISEASKRFYHGLTKKRLFQALDAATQMYGSIGGKLTALTIVDNFSQKITAINLNQSKINSLIGIDISSNQVEEFLQKLQFRLASHIESGNVVWKVTPPYFRLDTVIEEDLIEEVARMYGYEKIPAKPLSNNTPGYTQDLLFDLLEDLRSTLFQAGLTEVQTYSYYSLGIISNLKCQTSNLIKIANPISSETEYLRTDLWPNLLEVVARNIRNGIKNVAIFEIGKVYSQKNRLPQEKYRLAVALSGNLNNPMASLYQIFQSLKLKSVRLGENPNRAPGDIFHPARLLPIEKTGQNIGLIAEIHPRIVNRFGIEQRVAAAEIDITKLL